MKLEEEDVILCTVKKIEGTTVFLNIEGNGEGSMIFSEVSPGRIRNIRDFVSVGKKIVCKILRMREGHIELSLRRVTAKERDSVMDSYKKERILESMLKTVLKERAPSALKKIKEEYEVKDFLEEARNNHSIISKFLGKENMESFRKIIAEKKDKEKLIRKIITVSSNKESGINDIRSLLLEGETKDSEVKYDGSSQFSIYIKAKDFKLANKMMEEITRKMHEKSKALHVQFSIK